MLLAVVLPTLATGLGPKDVAQRLQSCLRGADSVGRQTTLSVVQATFLVIVADALFSIAFSALGL